jgi:hypothetical protein
MWTVSYRGYFIHGYCDPTERLRVQTPEGLLLGFFKSLRGARCAITRDINRH